MLQKHIAMNHPDPRHMFGQGLVVCHSPSQSLQPLLALDEAEHVRQGCRVLDHGA